MFAVDHRFALPNPALLSAPAKKSHSIVNRPIFRLQRPDRAGRIGRRRLTSKGARREIRENFSYIHIHPSSVTFATAL